MSADICGCGRPLCLSDSVRLGRCVVCRKDLPEVPKPRQPAALDVVFCGYGRAGKDTACAIWAKLTDVRNAGTCSAYLAKHVAARLGIPEAEAYARRHESVETRLWWRTIGDDVRATDPARFVREMAAAGEVGGGVRGLAEIRAARAAGLARLWVWIDNPRVPADPTCEFGPEECDITVRNDGTLDQFAERLRRLVAFAGMTGGSAE